MVRGKIALVTGGGRGIGAAAAIALAREGASVAILARTRAELEEVAATIRRADGRVLVLLGDVSDEADVERAFREAREGLGPVDIVVHCAATIERENVATMSLARWNQVIAVNVTGTFLICREAVRTADERGVTIVTFSSLGGLTGTTKFPGFAAYTASKFAVTGLTEALAAETKGTRVRINCIAPGAVDTAMLRRAAPTLRTDTAPADLGPLILFLADSDLSGPLNGSVIPVHTNLAE